MRTRVHTHRALVVASPSTLASFWPTGLPAGPWDASLSPRARARGSSRSRLPVKSSRTSARTRADAPPGPKTSIVTYGRPRAFVSLASTSFAYSG